ncbi:MAG: HD-GYP domain-containing protein, partial [Deltaproteobacteria bacterium]|nr:HD-GYP domain-containing protein [Deltaproteobacteria bacterium]
MPEPQGRTVVALKGISRGKVLLIVLATAVVSLLHFLTPAGPHAWHGLHLLYQKLYYVPILMAAAFLGVRGTLATALAVSFLFLVHILRDWSGDLMRQADQVGEIASFWVIAVASSFLFHRERRALERERVAHEETLSALASSLDLREHETALHSRRVRGYTMLLARRMGLKDEAALLNIAIGALLHDVGKIGLPDQVLLKQGELTEKERDEVRRHPELGATLIDRIPFLAGAREIVLAHHEKYDGSGYPKGLAGEDIPIGGRIFAVADVFDALTTDRPYRPALSYREAAESIAKESGSHFDPAAVAVFLKIEYADWAQIA